MRYRLTFTALLFLLPAVVRAAEPPAVTIHDGERIVLLGGTMIEREQRSGYWETALLLGNPGKKLTVRNLGWSGDTVWGEARAGFGNQAHGFKQLVDLVLASKPSLILLGYGGNEAFAGEAGLPRFVEGYETLLNALAPTRARLVFILPVRHSFERTPRINHEIDRYAAAVRELAARRKAAVIEVGPKSDAYADDHMHFTPFGYWSTARAFARPFGLSPVAAVPPPVGGPAGLPEAGEIGPASEAAEELRRLVVEKNELYFHRWRPQNETYLFGFRKHEQGKNAAEVAAFDPLVAAKEAEIDTLLKSFAKP